MELSPCKTPHRTTPDLLCNSKTHHSRVNSHTQAHAFSSSVHCAVPVARTSHKYICTDEGDTVHPQLQSARLSLLNDIDAIL